jgi:hypothetical protein
MPWTAFGYEDGYEVLGIISRHLTVKEITERPT